MKIAFLGLGKMGLPIARHLIRSGQTLTVWNRTASRAEVLAKEGAQVEANAAEAVSDADVVFTMVMDDASLEDLLDRQGVQQGLKREAIHVSLSTLSVAFSRQLSNEHRKRELHFIAAPVFGRPHVAEAGKLWIAVGGASKPVEIVRPLLETFSRGITLVSEHPWGAHALKLGGNFLITAMIASLTESFVFAEGMDLDPAVFLDAVNQALFQSPFYEMYGKIMLAPPEIPGATMAIGEKDMRLFRDAARSENVHTPLADLFMATFHRAFETGMKDADWAAGYLRLHRPQ